MRSACFYPRITTSGSSGSRTPCKRKKGGTEDRRENVGLVGQGHDGVEQRGRGVGQTGARALEEIKFIGGARHEDQSFDRGIGLESMKHDADAIAAVQFRSLVRATAFWQKRPARKPAPVGRELAAQNAKRSEEFNWLILICDEAGEAFVDLFRPTFKKAEFTIERGGPCQRPAGKSKGRSTPAILRQDSGGAC